MAQQARRRKTPGDPMTYTPNFNDPRIIKAATKALTFVELYTKSTEVNWISSTELYKHFGNTTRPLGSWLKAQLLDTRDNYFNPLTGACKKYSKRTEGVKLVKQLLNQPDFVPQINSDIMDQIISGDFDYTEKSDRLFTSAQFIPRRIRDSILNNAGYRYHYDIEAAAPRMLLQRAQHINPDLTLTHLDHYIHNRSQVRDTIAKNCSITPDQAKTVINAVLQGSVISKYKDSKLFMALNQDYDAVTKLQNDMTTQNLVKDIKVLWRTLKSEFPVRTITDVRGRTKSVRITSKQKSGYYRELESQVGKIIRKILNKDSVRYLWIHDGWRCDKVIDPNMIETEVRRKTGLVIKLEWTIYEDT
jgi:hypothetical protein